MNKKQVTVAAITTVALSGASFYLYKRYKLKKLMAEEPTEILTTEEAMAIANEHIANTAKAEPTKGAIKLVRKEEDEPVEEATHILKKGIDPNSMEAVQSYIRMELAEYTTGGDEYILLNKLFTYAFVPSTMGDEVLKGAIASKRAGYFGSNCRWNEMVSWADVLIWYAKKLGWNLNCDDNEYWVGHMLDQIGITYATTDDEIVRNLDALTNHTYYNEDKVSEQFGLFGLDIHGVEHMDEKLKYSVEQKYTFELELNAYIQANIDEISNNFDPEEED